MIECADLKNVINYQEVEALKHTIKVIRGQGHQKGDKEEQSPLKGSIAQQKTDDELNRLFIGAIYHQMEGSQEQRAVIQVLEAGGLRDAGQTEGDAVQTSGGLT